MNVASTTTSHSREVNAGASGRAKNLGAGDGAYEWSNTSTEDNLPQSVQSDCERSGRSARLMLTSNEKAARPSVLVRRTCGARVRGLLKGNMATNRKCRKTYGKRSPCLLPQVGQQTNLDVRFFLKGY